MSVNCRKTSSCVTCLSLSHHRLKPGGEELLNTLSRESLYSSNLQWQFDTDNFFSFKIHICLFSVIMSIAFKELSAVSLRATLPEKATTPKS